MQNLYDFLILKEFNINSLSVAPICKNIYIISKSQIPPFVRIKDIGLPWVDFLETRQEFVFRFNNLIISFLPDKEGYFFYKKDTCFWGIIYSNFGKNFLNFLFDSCKIFLEWQEGHFLELGRVSPNYYFKKKKLEYFNLKQFGYNPNLTISRRNMLYNNLYQNGACVVIRRQNILEEVLKKNVGFNVQYKIAQSNLIKNLNKIGKTNILIGQVRKILKKYLPAKTTIAPRNKLLVFLRNIIIKMVPNRIFIKRKFFNKFLQNISCIILNDLMHCITLGEIMDGMIYGHNLIIQNLFAKIVIWLIEEVVFKIISSCFYVTETNKSKELCYIVLSKWIPKEEQALKTIITKGQLQKRSTDGKKSCNQEVDQNFTHTLRFLPDFSLTKFRPIINTSLYQKDTEIFARRCNTFLRQLIATQIKMSTSITSNIQTQWANFVAKAGKKTKLYYVKTDIKDAYGSIDHSVLIDILNKQIGNIKCPYLKLSSFEFKGFGNRLIVAEQFTDLHISISAKLIKKKSFFKSMSLNMIKKYIFESINNIYVKPKNSRIIFQYHRGLPQDFIRRSPVLGMKLSASLCEIYYNDFDANTLKDLFSQENGDIMLRSVDDYLFVSKDKEKAGVFLERITNLSSKYGFEIQKEKTFTNLYDKISPHGSLSLPYFGYLLNFEKRTVSLDFSVYKGKNFKSTIMFGTPLNMENFKKRLCNLSGIKSSNLLFDGTFLEKRIIIKNIYKISCLLALRFLCLYRKFPKNQRNLKTIFTTIKDAISVITDVIYSGPHSLHEKGAGKLRKICIKYIIIKTVLVILKGKGNCVFLLKNFHAMLTVLRNNISIEDYKIVCNITKTIPASLQQCYIE